MGSGPGLSPDETVLAVAATGQQTRFIFVTGGLVSALGKGIESASIGRLLVARGFRVTIQKFDPYINVDPGTISPFFFFQAEDGIRDYKVTGVQTCALPI